MGPHEELYGGWSPGIGDPSLMGWLTVGGYLLAAHACRRAYLRARAAALAGASAERRVAWLWAGLGAFLLALGVNKQLDLQSLLTEVGRGLAYEYGWYEERRAVQRAFIMGVAIAACLIGLALLALARGHIARLLPALGGAVFLLAFVLVRASSFHRMDALIAADLFGLRLNWVLELGGILCTGASASRDQPRIPRREAERARHAPA